MTRHELLSRRLARVRFLQAKDIHRFKPNPLGAGFLNRQDRYNELRWQIQSLLEQALPRSAAFPTLEETLDLIGD